MILHLAKMDSIIELDDPDEIITLNFLIKES